MSNWKRCLIVIALIALLAVAGFAGGEKEKGAGTAGSITLATNNAPEGQAMAQALRQYGEDNGIETEVVESPYANLFEKEMLDLSQATGLYDVILLDDPWFTQFAENGWLTDLEPYYEDKGQSGPSDDFIKASRDLGRHPHGTGTLFAVPAVGNAQMFFYRTDLYSEYGLPDGPETWSEALEVMQQITQDEENVYGYVLRGQQGNPVVAQFMPIFWSFGGKMFNREKTEVMIDTPEALEALNFFLDLKEVSPPGAESFNAQQLATHVMQGTAASTINWPAFVSSFENPDESRVVGQMGYSAIPDGTVEGSSEIGHWLAAIPESSDNKQAAFDYIYWATSAEMQKQLALEHGNPPTRRSVFLDEELNSMDQFRHFPVLMEAIANSTPRPRIANWNEVENTFGIQLSRAVAGQVSPKEALETAQEEVEQLMRNAGYME